MADLVQKKILVAVDGSEHALEMVRYVSRTVSPERFHVVLFHVVANLPEAFMDSELKCAYQYKLVNTSQWESLQQDKVRTFMGEACRILMDAGFTDDGVTLTAQIRKQGIARDIIEESLRGYEGVVVGRKGLSPLKDLVMGSTAEKLVEKISHVPVWIVGGNLQGKKILVCMDISEGAMQAVDYVGGVLGGSSDFEVTLFHITTDHDIVPQPVGETLVRDLRQEWVENASQRALLGERAMESTFAEARARLVKAGFDPQRVIQKAFKGAGKRGVAIVEEAQQGGYDTVVVGRRGLSKVQEFFMGRVSNKVIQLAKERTVWVVSRATDAASKTASV